MGHYHFQYLWNVHFPNLIPLPHEFKKILKYRWLRIHNFGVSQRYPRQESDITQVLERQNRVLLDLCQSGTSFIVLVGGGQAPGFPEGYETSVKLSEYTLLESLPHHLLEPEEYLDAIDPHYFIQWAYREIQWKWGMLDTALTEIAQDKLGALFIYNLENNCLIYPYGGGMDIIAADLHTRNLYKEKYKDWVSPLPSGL